MDMNTFRPEIHVAQQSRRDKLRFHNASSNPPNHHHHHLFGVYNNNHNNLSYDPPEFCPEINHFNHPSDNVINRHHHDPQTYFSTWKSIGSQSDNNCWVSANNNQNPPIFVNSSDNPTMPDVKPFTNLGYQELHSSNNNTTNHQSSDYYHSALQELVSTSGARSFVPVSFSRQRSSDETSHGPWVVNGGELLLLPAYADQLGLKGPDDYSNTQALALSLSSVPSPKVHEAERDNNNNNNNNINNNAMVQDFRIPKNLGNARQDHASGNQALTNRKPGPLGPFTGYATILRSSKFLRPAQVLLEDLCGVVGRPRNVALCEEADRAFLDDTRVSDEGNGIDPAGMKALADGDSSGWMDSYRPENIQKKAKLLYMQDEVYKKYKQYHQQMQMVVSSFETVAGLSASTPYVSLALKVVSKHFRCLKNAIKDQLKSIRNTLGEELLSPSAGTSSGKGEGGVSMLKFFDQSFQKQKGVSSNVGINLDGQNIWRPQRGLPERAVSILRAWLFDHFLHPYPTDTDKHMLATQTGLTRNQVSNWFINARVRVWKPMVEEIHMLETNGMVDAGSDGKTTMIADRDQENHTGQCSNTNTLRTSKMPDNYSSDFDPSEHTPDRSNPSKMWNQEKRSRIDYHVPASAIDPTLMGFVPSHRSGAEMAGMGSVSLTLGLRQSAENGQRQSEHHRLRQHYGGQMIRDFVG